MVNRQVTRGSQAALDFDGVSRLTATVQSSSGNIDAWTRAYAEDQARRAGLPLRDWLHQFVAQETGRSEGPSLERELDRTPAPLSLDAAIEPHAEFAGAVGGWDSPAGFAYSPELDDAFALAATPSTALAPSAVVALDCVEATGVARFDQFADPVCADRSADLLVETGPSGAVVDELPERSVAAPTPPEALAEATATAEQPQDRDIEQALDGLAAQVDAIRDQLSARMRQESARRLDGIERALRQIRQEVEATDTSDDSGAACFTGTMAAPQHGEAPLTPFRPAEAIEDASVEVARLVDAVNRGFERSEAICAEQMADLRGVIVQMFEGLAARIDNLEQRSSGAATEGERQPSPAARSEFECGPFDARPVLTSIGGPLDITQASPADPWGATAAAAPVGDPADREPADRADVDLAFANEGQAQSASPQLAARDLPESAETWADFEHGGQAGDTQSDETPHTAEATGRIAELHRQPSPGRAKKFIFPRLGFGDGRLLRKSA